MPEYHQPPSSWKLEGGGHVLDLETAVKDGILGGGGGDHLGSTKVELKKMIEELETADDVDIPSVFICPISLEPMIDPVTLCTGQTYERSNILRWFSMGHLTCPTTMQELWDDGAVTPNRTLHHLSHAWFSQRYLRMTKRAADVQGQAAELIASLHRLKGQSRVNTLKSLRRLAAAHPSARNSGGAAAVSSLLGPFTSYAVGSEAVGILVNLPLTSEAKSTLMQPARISLIVDLLNEGSIETKIDCARLIEMLMADKDFKSEVVSSPSLLVGLLRLVRNPDGAPLGLGLLSTICSHGPLRGLVVSVGAVPRLVELLPGLKPGCLEPALHILESLSAVPEGRAALRGCPQTIPSVVRLIMRVSEACTQHALSILWEVCKLAPEECGLLAVEAGLAAKLLLVIQSGCSPELKQRASELLKLCSLNYTTTHFMSKCKLTRTIQ